MTDPVDDLYRELGYYTAGIAEAPTRDLLFDLIDLITDAISTESASYPPLAASPRLRR